MKKIILVMVTLLLSLSLFTQKAYAYIPDNSYYYGKTDLIGYDLDPHGLYYTSIVRFLYTSDSSLAFPNDYEASSVELMQVFDVLESYHLNFGEFYPITKYIFANDDNLLLEKDGLIIETIGRPNQIMFDLTDDTIKFLDKNGDALYTLIRSSIDPQFESWILKSINYFQQDGGYDKGKQDYGIYYNGEWLTAQQWGDIQYSLGTEAGIHDGYNLAEQEYGHYDGTDYITADEWGDKRYNDGLGQNRNFYGYLYNGNWLTAEQWGDIRYDVGYNDGLSGEIDWWSWATTFFLMPFKILNIQVLPGIRIGYFALFSLLLGVVGWFFFLVGKGGGRRK